MNGGVSDSCGGTGYLTCFCGGDICVCLYDGEIECPGCPDCNWGEDEPSDDEHEDDEEDENFERPWPALVDPAQLDLLNGAA